MTTRPGPKQAANERRQRLAGIFQKYGLANTSPNSASMVSDPSHFAYVILAKKQLRRLDDRERDDTVYEVTWEYTEGPQAGSWCWGHTMDLSFQGACRLGLAMAEGTGLKLIRVERLVPRPPHAKTAA